ALAVSALAVILVFGLGVALRTGAFLAGALLAGALLGDWERDFVVIGKSAYQNSLKFFAAFSSNLVRLSLLEWCQLEREVSWSEGAAPKKM
ncbi:MAG: hypothetical protein KDD60_03865, partial [Bdellovibrionales bacterium]|nr:hypothetical protein [Bdellovibrionales bacterium]